MSASVSTIVRAGLGQEDEHTPFSWRRPSSEEHPGPPLVLHHSNKFV